jgi:hypothetical protein
MSDLELLKIYTHLSMTTMSKNLFDDGNVNDVETLQANWRDAYLQWWSAGMPSYSQTDKQPWKQLTVKFRTKEDRQYFSDLMNYNLTDKTYTVAYPPVVREINLMNRYVQQGMAQDMNVLEETEDQLDE